MGIWDQVADLDLENAPVELIEAATVIAITITVLGVDHQDAVVAEIIIIGNVDDLDLLVPQEDENLKGIHQ